VNGTEDENVPRDPPLPGEPLGGWERAVALGVGIAAGGGGAYAVFASSNQAGTAILLILSAIFLLIGIQGTSLIRFSSGSNMFELERRKRGIEKAVVAAAKEDPDRAAGIIEGAEIALPMLGSFGAAEAAVYEERVAAALGGLGYIVSTLGRPGISPDFMVMERGATGRVVFVEVKYRKRPRLEIRTVAEIFSRAYSQGASVLIVTNADFSERDAEAAAEYVAREPPGRVVRWRDDSDNDTLQQAISELLAPYNPLRRGLTPRVKADSVIRTGL
jgi:hypothetical protein